MKETRTLSKRNRLLAAILSAVLLACAAGLPTVTAFADPEPKTAFLSAASELDPTANYATAKEAADRAGKAYLLLSGEELTDPSVVEAKSALDAENERLLAFAARADAFVTLVASLADATVILQKKEILNLAAEKEVTDESYEGVSEAHAAYLTEKEAVEAAVLASEAYLDAMGKAADDFDAGEGYRTVKENFDLALTYKRDIDASYPGVTSALGAEKKIEAALLEIRQTNEIFLSSIERMKAAKTYSEFEEKIRTAEKNLEDVEDFDYDGIEEGIGAIADAKAELAARMATAVNYISLVSAATAASGDGLFAAYAAAREAEADTDLTVSSAKAAKDSLDRFAADHEATVAAANSVMTFWLGVALAK